MNTATQKARTKSAAKVAVIRKGDFMIATKKVTRKVPVGASEMERTANLTFPSVYNEDGTADLQTILSTVGGLDKLATLVQDSISRKAEIIGRNELGKADAASKALTKAAKALAKVTNMEESAAAAILANTPQFSAALQSTDVPQVIDMNITIEDIFTDGRRKKVVTADGQEVEVEEDEEEEE